MKIKNKILSLALLGCFSSASMAANYCTAIRGNGELAPAHWSGLARIIENKGLPSSVAGGSSASVTMFFLDALSRNENLSSNVTKKQVEQALLLKTIVPHILYLTNKDAKAPKLMGLIANVTGLGKGGFVDTVKKAIAIAGDFDDFMEVLGEYGPLLNPELVTGLRNDFSFYKDQIAESINVFGVFDAKTDANLFYRKGLVDFKFLGMLFGRVADFYAGYGNSDTNRALINFLNECRDDSLGKTWDELIAVNTNCSEKLTVAFDSYYAKPTKIIRGYRQGRKIPYQKEIELNRSFPNRMIFEKIGSGLSSLPSTAVVMKDAAARYKKLSAIYEITSGTDVDDFSLDFETDLRYGYWGSLEDLTNVKKNLPKMYPEDTKSSKFMAMKNGTWFEVLATSPAEPGLANLQRIPKSENINKNAVINKSFFRKKFFGLIPTLNAVEWFNEKNPNQGVIPFRENLYSAGGWSDLHPVLTLKAKGCEDVVYLTRQNGESVFGQQVFIRLTGYTEKIRFWKDIGDGNRVGWINLTEDEENSPWNRLYNLMNPKASFNKSISEATAIYCTNWDHYNLFKGEVKELVHDAYNAPVFVKKENDRKLYPFGLESEGHSKDGFPGCLLKEFND